MLLNPGEAGSLVPIAAEMRPSEARPYWNGKRADLFNIVFKNLAALLHLFLLIFFH